MIVVVRAGQAIRVDDGENLRELAVDAVGQSPATVATAGAGELDGDHLWIDVDVLRSHGPGTKQWLAGFAAMIEFAAGRGWTDPARNRVRAHVRWG